MASQRRAPNEKLVSEQQGGPPSSSLASDTNPAVSAGVIVKLLGFTFAMAALPIGSYFATVHTVFKGNATYAGGFAALLANVVLIAYVVVAMKEDQTDRLDAEQKAKKAQ